MNKRLLIGCGTLVLALAVLAGALAVSSGVGRAADVDQPAKSQQHVASYQAAQDGGYFGFSGSHRATLVAVFGALGIALVGASVFIGPRQPAPAGREL